MSMDASEILVMIPDRFGLAVVTASQLLDRLADGEPLEDAIGNSAIDMVGSDIVEHANRLRQLNETGDANAYWHLDVEPEPEPVCGHDMGDWTCILPAGHEPADVHATGGTSS